ncbi:MAG: hypothetical protein ACYTHM_06515 [Planctomycetota bacterium]|jgi:tetratricopeptide (TPR) repeat protein
MFTRNGFVLLLTGFALLLPACSSTEIPVSYTRPPKESIPPDVKKVGVMPFTVGKQVKNKGIGDRLQRQVESALLKAKDCYIVITRSALEDMVKEHKLSMSGIAKGEVKELEVPIVDAMIIGAIDQAWSKEGRDRIQTLEWVKSGPHIPLAGRLGLREVPKIKTLSRGRYMAVELTISFQMINYKKGGEVIASHVQSASYDSRRALKHKDRWYALPPEKLPQTHRAKLEEMIEEEIKAFLAMIAPTKVTKMVVLLDRGPYNTQGVAYAENGFIKDALEQFNLAIKNDRPNDAGFYNRGVMLELMGDYTGAFKAFKNANTANPDDLYLAAMKRMREEIEIHEEE